MSEAPVYVQRKEPPKSEGAVWIRLSRWDAFKRWIRKNLRVF